MGQPDMQHQAAVDGGTSAPDGYSPASEAPPPATRLLDLLPELLDDIACRVMQLGARSLLPLTCRAFSQARMLHVPALRIQLGRQCCDQVLTPRVVAALQVRTSKLTFTLLQPDTKDSESYKEPLPPTWQLPQTEDTQDYTELLAYALTKLDNCAAVEDCKLVSRMSSYDSSGKPNNSRHLRCTPGLAQQLLDSFPSLTALTLQGLSVSSNELASLLSHPPLALQLQQLHLTDNSYMDGEEPGTVSTLLQGLQLKQLSIAAVTPGLPGTPRLPSFEPLKQHLTQLGLNCNNHIVMSDLRECLQPLAQLQVLILMAHDGLKGLAEVVQALPQLHTLQLPDMSVWAQQDLNPLLAATQITSLQLRQVEALDPSYADAPCSWQRLEIQWCEWEAITHLPLHSLTQPLVLGMVGMSVEHISHPEVAAALHLLASLIKVPVKIKTVELNLRNSKQQQERVDLAHLISLLPPPQRCCVDKVDVRGFHRVTAADVLALAPVCRDCTHFKLCGGSVEPSLEFWHLLVQLMPAVQQVDFIHVEGSVTAAMHESLQLMAEQPWARWLHVTLYDRHTAASMLPACWQAGSWVRAGNIKHQACTRLRSHSSSARAPLDSWQQLVQLCLQCSRSISGLWQVLLPYYVRATAVYDWAALGQVAVSAAGRPLPACCLDMNKVFNNPSQPGRIKAVFDAQCQWLGLGHCTGAEHDGGAGAWQALALAEQRQYVNDSATQIGVGINPNITQTVSAASGVWDETSGQLESDQLVWWKLAKGQVRQASGLNNARLNTQRWLAPIQPHLQLLAAASSAGTSLEANRQHVTTTLATWDAVWEVYLDPKWAQLQLRLEQSYKEQQGRLVLVDEHRTSRASSTVNGQQPCEEELNHEQPTRRAGWKPPVEQGDLRLLRPAWSQQRDESVRGLMWCLVVAPRTLPSTPQPAASEPQPSTPPPAKRSKRTKAEQAAEPTQPTKGTGKGKVKAAKAKPCSRPGRGLARHCNASLHMQRIGESRWRPLELRCGAVLEQRSDASVDGEAPSALLGPLLPLLPGTPLLELPAALLDDVARRAIQLGAGGAVSRTCGAFSKTNLLHAPALYIQLDSQRCDQQLTPRVVAALQARTCKLALTLERQPAQSSRQYIALLTEVLKKLTSCTAVEACKLGTSKSPCLGPHETLGSSPDLAQHLMGSFPSLTSLSLHNFSIPCSDLATLLSHPRLSLQLQQLDLSSTTILCLPRLLQALPRLHTLHLPGATVRGQEQLDALLAATQLTSLKLHSLKALSSSRADAPCSWQRLELTHWIDCTTAAYLPYHSLTQPLLLGYLGVDLWDDGDGDDGDDGGDASLLVAAAVHNLTQACKVAVRIKGLELDCSRHLALAPIDASLPHFQALLQPLHYCGLREVVFTGVQGFWRQLVQLMPTVTNVVFQHVGDSTSSAMHQSLQLMAEQPWARWLDICIEKPSASYRLPACWRASPLTQPGKLRVWFNLANPPMMPVSPRRIALGFVQSKHIPARVTRRHRRGITDRNQQTVPAMSQSDMQHQVAVDGGASATDGYSPAGQAPPPATRLLDLLPELLDDIACRVMQLEARSQLPLTCRAFSQAHLLHVPALRIQLGRQCCDQLLTPRVVAALQARTSKLTLTLEQPETKDSMWYKEELAPTLQLPQTEDTQHYTDVLAHALAKLDNCAAVEVCKLVSSGVYDPDKRRHLHCSPGLAQQLLDSFSSLTALTLLGLCVSSAALTSLISHTPLARQLQQLDIAHIISQDGDAPGAVDPLFQGLRLKQLCIAAVDPKQAGTPPLPSFQFLAQHLTQLHLMIGCVFRTDLSFFREYLQPLAQLQVLTISNLYRLKGLTEVLQALPQLHTLQLPDVTVRGQQELDTLLAATQITRLQLATVKALDTSHANRLCSWQRLELTAIIQRKVLTYLPLLSLSQLLVLGRFAISVEDIPDPEVADVLHLLAEAIQVPVQIKEVELRMRSPENEFITPALLQQQREDLVQLVSLLQPLQCCCVRKVEVRGLYSVTAADVQALAPLCRDCTHFELWYGSIEPSLEFWHQLVQLMPAVQKVDFVHVEGSISAAMHESLQLMAEQPWAQWLDVTICDQFTASELPACWQAGSWVKAGIFNLEGLEGLTELPQLHTLQLPGATVREQDLGNPAGCQARRGQSGGYSP
ncbi:hypothetical protein QJQ45_008890 [Haematococcus lacustris]|nr:hypothetical protein QJQ45_008890 [Haematococcus lacustris]